MDTETPQEVNQPIPTVNLDLPLPESSEIASQLPSVILKDSLAPQPDLQETNVSGAREGVSKAETGVIPSETSMKAKEIIDGDFREDLACKQKQEDILGQSKEFICQELYSLILSTRN